VRSSRDRRRSGRSATTVALGSAVASFYCGTDTPGCSLYPRRPKTCLDRCAPLLRWIRNSSFDGIASHGDSRSPRTTSSSYGCSSRAAPTSMPSARSVIQRWISHGTRRPSSRSSGKTAPA